MSATKNEDAKNLIIVLTGMPASGKSTAAAAVSKALGLAVLEKDAIKEALFDTLGFADYRQKRMLDHAANAVLLTCAEALLKSGQSVILDNNFDRIAAESLNRLIRRSGCRCISLIFEGNPEIFYERYVARDNAHKRHPGHVLQEHYPPLPGESADYAMTREEFREKFESRGMDRFQCEGTEIHIDATYPEQIDMDSLLSRLRLLTDL